MGRRLEVTALLSIGSKVFVGSFFLTWLSTLKITRRRWGIVVHSVCLCFNSFIFLEQVVVINRDTLSIDHSCPLLSGMLYLIEQKLTIHRSHKPSDDQTLTLASSIATHRWWCFPHCVFSNSWLEWCGFWAFTPDSRGKLWLQCYSFISRYNVLYVTMSRSDAHCGRRSFHCKIGEVCLFKKIKCTCRTIYCNDPIWRHGTDYQCVYQTNKHNPVNLGEATRSM